MQKDPSGQKMRSHQGTRRPLTGKSIFPHSICFPGWNGSHDAAVPDSPERATRSWGISPHPQYRNTPHFFFPPRERDCTSSSPFCKWDGLIALHPARLRTVHPFRVGGQEYLPCPLPLKICISSVYIIPNGPDPWNSCRGMDLPGPCRVIY